MICKISIDGSVNTIIGVFDLKSKDDNSIFINKETLSRFINKGIIYGEVSQVLLKEVGRHRIIDLENIAIALTNITCEYREDTAVLKANIKPYGPKKNLIDSDLIEIGYRGFKNNTGEIVELITFDFIKSVSKLKYNVVLLLKDNIKKQDIPFSNNLVIKRDISIKDSFLVDLLYYLEVDNDYYILHMLRNRTNINFKPIRFKKDKRKLRKAFRHMDLFKYVKF